MAKAAREEKVGMWVFYDSRKRDYKCYFGSDEDYWPEAELPEYVLEKWFSGERYELVDCYNIRKSKKGLFKRKVIELDGNSRHDVKEYLEKLYTRFS